MSSNDPRAKTDQLSVIHVPFFSHEFGSKFSDFLNELPAFLWVEDLTSLVVFLQKSSEKLKGETLQAESELGHQISLAMQQDELGPVVIEWNKRAKQLTRAAIKSDFEANSLIARAYEGLLREILFEIIQDKVNFEKRAYWKVFDETILLHLFVHVDFSLEDKRCIVYLAGVKTSDDSTAPTDRLARQNALLFDVSQSILTETNHDRFLSQTSQLMLEHFDAYMVYITLVDVQQRLIKEAVLNGRILDEEEIKQDLSDENFWQGLSGWAIRTGETVYSPKEIPDFRENDYSRKRREILEIGSVVVVPIHSHPDILGTLTVIHTRDQRNMGKHDIQIAGTIANQIAIGLRHFELQERMMRMLHTDLVTNLHNRQYFMELMEKEFNESKSGGFPLGLIVIDIDHFTEIRKKYGAQIAHDMLTMMGERLTECLSARQAELGRLDSNTFCALCKIYDREALWDIAECIRVTIEKTPFISGPIVMKVTISLGICHLEDLNSGASMRECLSAANQNVMVAKQKGRNQVYPPKDG